MAITITRDDIRFHNLNKAYNQRYPVSPAQGPGAVALCQSPEDVRDALQAAVSAGKRPTIRAGGSCYEDFYINNPDGVLIDVGMMNFTGSHANDSRIHVGPGATMGKAYLDLYKLFNGTLPGASCSVVTAGGHIVGGGYGFLSRLYGTTTDWVSELQVATVDAKGRAQLRRVNAKNDPDLFRALQGCGGGNYGVITDYVFDKLPAPPREVILTRLQFSWTGMTEERFGKILTAYGNYFQTRGTQPDTFGLFTIMGLNHRNTGGFGISVQFCNPDGTCRDLSVLNEFLALFDDCGADRATPVRSGHTAAGAAALAAQPPSPRAAQLFAENCASCHGSDGKGGDGGTNIASLARVVALSDADLHNVIRSGSGSMPGFTALSEQETSNIVRYLRGLQNPTASADNNPPAGNPMIQGENGGYGGGGGGGFGGGGGRRSRNAPPSAPLPCGQHNLNHVDWFVTDGSGSARAGGGQRAKYKSIYMRKTFSPHEISTWWKHLTQDVPGENYAGCSINVDSFGGAVNSPAMLKKTVITARHSVLKLQFMMYWNDPAEDDAHMAYVNNLYTDLFTSPQLPANRQGAPCPGENYEGCFICYPDSYLLKYDWWPELYWGREYKFLQQVKRKYDPNNIFHHAMSIRA